MNEEHRLAQAILNANVRRMMGEITTPNPLAEFLRAEMKPLTRWERVQRWFRIRGERIVLAWCVLRGDDIHEDC